MKFLSRPENEIVVEKIAAMLQALPFDGVLSYDELKPFGEWSAVYRRLATARKRVERESGVRFESIRGGVKKLSGASVAGIGGFARKRIGRLARGASQRLTGLKYNDITSKDRAVIDAERSLLGAVSALTTTSARQGVSEGSKSGPLSASEVMKALAGQKE